MDFTVLSIYPAIITLGVIVSTLWLFAVSRLKNGMRNIALGIGIIGITLAIENSYYFFARMLSIDDYLNFSYLYLPVAAMKGFYVVGLMALLIGFGGEK